MLHGEDLPQTWLWVVLTFVTLILLSLLLAVIAFTHPITWLVWLLTVAWGASIVASRAPLRAG